MEKKETAFEILGLMSGSSLDGLDMAHCRFQRTNQGWKGKILKAKTQAFPPELLSRLKSIRRTSALKFSETEALFVKFSAEAVENFIQKHGLEPIAIASHGHTAFHNPAAGYTFQMGNGGLLAGLLRRPVISDFRTMDAGNGGQGAPLVPGAERFLFSQYDACLNLGGIANVSFNGEDGFLGFDIAPCNQLLNLAASWCHLPYDKDGLLAVKGRPLPKLLRLLNSLRFYKKLPPKSLGNEDVAKIWMPMLMSFSNHPEDVLHTLCMHIAHQVASAIQPHRSGGKLLVTGGGAFHGFLMGCLRNELGRQWSAPLPSGILVSYKEAYCFAFLGLLRLLGEKNVFRSITGANEDLVSGAIYGVQWLKM